MLQLKDIKKDYITAGAKVPALKGVSLRFRQNEFVSILGASGCGKTTLLNIIGGLDHYTSGDLVICGVSTKNYKDHDWDVYRNHRIGFVFQSYNLIPHQTVLGNVELALTIAGVSKAERRRRAEEALIKVGLGSELNKRPNQLSGGQMQRVAIARALVNNPEILLADEPTGALDTQTSVQIMELIREIAGERLVIMVTHNPELAEQYSSRIVRLQDGLVISDTNPYEGDEVNETETETPAIKIKKEVQTEFSSLAEGEKKRKEKKVKERSSMSFATSLGLSARNLLTKKGRTAITSIAGSIGIISVCLVLALSNGFNQYILQTQEDMLSSNPIEIKETTYDLDAIMSGLNSAGEMPDLEQIGDKVYVNSFLTNIANGMQVNNDLSDEYIEYLESMDEDIYTAIVYSTGVDISNNLFTEVTMGDATQEENTQVISLSSLKAYYTDKLSRQDEKYASLAPMVEYLGSIYGKMPGTIDVEAERYGEYVLSQYEVIGEGHFPKEANEAVLVVGDNNDITDLTLAQLGLLSERDFLALFPQEGETVEDVEEIQIPFDDIVGKKFMLNYNDAIYTENTAENATTLYSYDGMRQSLDIDTETETDGVEITVSGVLRLKEGLTYGCLGSGLYFTEQLIDEYLAVNENSKIAKSVKKQTTEQTKITNEIYAKIETMRTLEDQTERYKILQEIFKTLNDNKHHYVRAADALASYYTSAEQMLQALVGQMPPEYQGMMAQYKDMYFLYGDSALRAVGGKTTVNSIDIYTDTFEAKQLILQHLDSWNDTHEKETQVKYTDTIGMIMSMVEMMLNAITYVLVAFTAISLVVSSVMIGIITYVSVVERTKEIGVLRSLGARKSDIKNLFNAETFIIGLTSGVFGVAVTYLLSGVINVILGALTGIATLAALPITSAIIMICVSVGLTLISGLIPAQAAAKKDPVIALRTE